MIRSVTWSVRLDFCRVLINAAAVCVQYEEHAMMSRLRDMEHREMVDELNRKISQLEVEVLSPQNNPPPVRIFHL